MAELAALGRIQKPHGTKGEVIVLALTENPGREFDPGRLVRLVNESGGEIAGPLKIAKRRRYHRRWLVAFEGVAEREAIEAWRNVLIVPDA